jgi:uncharacterized protein (TIGR03000 family)
MMFTRQMRARSVLNLFQLPLVLALSLGAAWAAPESADAADPAAAAEPAVITVHVPAGAIVQFDGVETRHEGITRRFETPPLTPGRSYSYDVSVSWTDGGQTVVRQRRVSFWAGERITLNFGPSVLRGDAGGLLEDPAAPNPSGTAYNQNPLNWPVYPRLPGSQPASPAGLPAQAGIRVLVPADAEVNFDGEPTTQKGTERLFTTPVLQAGKKYHYDILARWKENGKTVDRTRRVEVSAGTTVQVDLRPPLPENKAKGSERRDSR